jgi:hypothetical protein
MPRGRAFYAVVGVLALAAAAGIVAVTTVSSADTPPLAGAAVPAQYRPVLTDAAASCPALTPARLAGQIMAESGFSASATTDRGGSGIAGLTDAEWKTWQPTANADRGDPAANILALAHHVCDLVGHVRVDKVNGDLWVLAVAAYRSGVAAVVAAGGVPASAQSYVDNVGGYAAWYALQPEFGGTGTPATTTPPATTPSATPYPATGTTAPAPPPTPVTAATRALESPRGPALPPPTADPTSGELWNDEFHGCLTAGQALDGTHLAVVACDGSMVQHWQPMPDGTIRSAGLCMDAAWAGTSNGTAVQVANCSGNPAQLFTLSPQHHLYSPYANKCVNIDYNPTSGTSIILFSCLDQTNQIFTFRAQ